jgi:hypothetical protein
VNKRDVSYTSPHSRSRSGRQREGEKGKERGREGERERKREREREGGAPPPQTSKGVRGQLTIKGTSRTAAAHTANTRRVRGEERRGEAVATSI